MDDFIQLPSEERRVYFEQAAAQLGLSAQLIEKDFWVCWTLRRLFSLEEFRGHLTFKGGTSLSKVYKIIERFSEDVDISVERSFLGFGGAHEPERASSGKEQQRRIAQLMEACQIAIEERLAPQLEASIAAQIADESAWKLQRDTADRDGQTLIFTYPPSIAAPSSPYISASVKIEIGARSDHFPVEDADVTPYVSEALPGALLDESTTVRVLGAERTFWEKATILHMLHHLPAGKKSSPRMSRHYYDVFRLSNSHVMSRAMQHIQLLERVAIHKSVFFKSAWARYDKARPGTLRLCPREESLSELRQDYAAMGPMFFSDAPAFDAILKSLQEWEERINAV